MNTKLVRFTKRLLDVMYHAGIIITLLMPVIFYYVGFYIEIFKKYYLVQCFVYMASGLLCIRIVHELRKMFITVLNEDPFVDSNALSLKIMGKSAFLTAALSLLRLPISLTPATVVVMVVFSIAGLFSIVLCQVFEKAIQYKRENDLTI